MTDCFPPRHARRFSFQPELCGVGPSRHRCGDHADRRHGRERTGLGTVPRSERHRRGQRQTADIVRSGVARVEGGAPRRGALVPRRRPRQGFPAIVDADRTGVSLPGAADGKSQWTFSLPGKVGHTHTRNTLASGTAAVGKESVYVTLWDGDRLHLFGFDLDGHKLWSRDLGTFTSQHGPGHSPIVEGELVLFVNEQDEYAKLMAFHAKTGETVWEASREKSRSCYSTPLVRDRADGTREVVVASTTGIGGYEVKTGRELWLWTWAGNKLRTVASPIESHGLVFVTGGDGGGSRNAAAVRLDGEGKLGESFVAWSGGRGFPYVPSLLASGDHLYMVHGRGHCGVSFGQDRRADLDGADRGQILGESDPGRRERADRERRGAGHGVPGGTGVQGGRDRHDRRDGVRNPGVRRGATLHSGGHAFALLRTVEVDDGSAPGGGNGCGRVR